MALLLVLVGCGNSPETEPLQGNAAQSASGSAGPIEVEEAWIPPPPGRSYSPGSGMVVGLTLVNHGSAWDSLVSVSSPVAGRATVSQYNITQDFISLTTAPESVHAAAQFHDNTGTVSPGEEVPVTFTFRSAGSLTLQVPVRSEPRVSAGSQ